MKRSGRQHFAQQLTTVLDTGPQQPAPRRHLREHLLRHLATVALDLRHRLGSADRRDKSVTFTLSSSQLREQRRDGGALFDRVGQPTDSLVERSQLGAQALHARGDLGRFQRVEDTIDDRLHDGRSQYVARERLQHGIVDTRDWQRERVAAHLRPALVVAVARVEERAPATMTS